MPELHDLLKRRARSYEPPPDLRDRVLQRSRRRELKRRVGAGLTAAAILAGFALGAWGVLRSSPSRQPVSPPNTIPAEQTAIIRQVVEASNARDAGALASSFSDDGTFNPFARWGAHPVHRGEVIPTWMENVDAWGLDARVRSCDSQTESMVDCDVRTRWHTLQMEMIEVWSFSFEGPQLTSLVMIRSDRDPTDRSLPLGYRDLALWESWLEEAHPEQAAILLRDSSLIVSFLRYDPTVAEEIGASIQEYLDRQPVD